MRTTLLAFCPLAAGLAWTTAILNPAAAQSPSVTASPAPEMRAASTPGGNSKSAEKKKGWRVAPALGVDAEYDDNVFLLALLKKDNLAAPSSAEAISGRYADMQSAKDVLTTMSAGLSLKGPGLFGRSTTVTPGVAYELYTRNTARSNVSLGLALQQELTAGSRLRVQGRLTPNYFARNYMADAVDLDGNGSIADAERVYVSGEYREGEFGADYRLRLAKSSKKQPFGASLQLGGGYYNRTYDAVLSGRGLHGPTAGAKLQVDLGQRISVDVGYDYASLAADRSNQVVLLDEPDFGQDLNGNGTTTDLSARALTMVDRSRSEQSLGASLQFGFSKPVDLTLGYEHRWRSYASDWSLDVVNRGRRDTRNQMSADLRIRLTKELRLRLGGVHAAQKLNRAGDPTGEIDDYNRSVGRLGLSYEL
ncbi:MAG: hypothetical protein ABI037_08495 [Gemmatimonadales bacterium]